MQERTPPGPSSHVPCAEKSANVQIAPVTLDVYALHTTGHSANQRPDDRWW